LRTAGSVLLLLLIAAGTWLVDVNPLSADEPQPNQVLLPAVIDLNVEPAGTPAPDASRFGVAVNAQQKPLSYYPQFSDLEVTWYQNWSCVPWWNKDLKPPAPEVVPGVQYYPTVGAWGCLEGSETASTLQTMIAKCPGCFPNGTVWIIGNELQIDKFDRLCSGAVLDPPRSITPAEYAVKYKKYYDMIKGINPTYQIAIGVTFDRIAWSDFLRETRVAYETRYGQRMPIDVYTIHAYMSDPPLAEVTRLVNNKRVIMKEYGDQNKPLIMTETGVLTDRGIGLIATPEQINAYMDSVFTYLANYTSDEYGCPDDGYRMVQKWAWFALTAANGDNTDLQKWDGTDLFDTGSTYATLTALGANMAAFPKSDPPSPPWWVWGSAQAGGSNVATGTAISAWINNVRVARTTAINPAGVSSYSLDVVEDDPNTPIHDGGQWGDTVRFKIGSSWAAQSGTWASGDTAEIALTIPAYASSLAPSSLWGTYFRVWGPQNRYPRMVGDVNGDGKADAVAIDPARGAFVALSTGTAFAKQSQWTSDFAWYGDALNPRVLGDVNGDGKEDMVGFMPEQGVYVGLSTGTGFAPATLWSTAFQTYTPQINYPRMVADVNGDGKDDIVAFHYLEGVYVGLSTGSSFAEPTRWTTDFAWRNDDWDHRVLADVNGDTLADVVGFKYGDGGGVFVGLSTGSAFAPASLWFPGLIWWGPQLRYPRMAADMNGDGLADVVAFDPGDGRGTFVWLSTGSSFVKTGQWSPEFNWLNDPWRPRLVDDANGDGRADVIAYEFEVGVRVALSQ